MAKKKDVKIDAKTVHTVMEALGFVPRGDYFVVKKRTFSVLRKYEPQVIADKINNSAKEEIKVDEE